MSCLVSRHGSGRRRPEGRTGPYSTGHPIPAAVADRIRDRHLPSRPNRISAAQPRGSPAHTSYSILSARRVPYAHGTARAASGDARRARWTNRLPYSTAYSDVFTRLRSTVRLAARQSAIPDRAWRISSRRGTRDRRRRGMRRGRQTGSAYSRTVYLSRGCSPLTVLLMVMQVSRYINLRACTPLQ